MFKHGTWNNVQNDSCKNNDTVKFKEENISFL